MKNIRWGHAPEEHPERWFGSFLSKQEVIAEGKKTYPSNEAFYVCAGTLANGPGYMPDADELEEMIWQAAHDDVGEAAEDFPDLTEQAKTELSAFLKGWAERHVKALFWNADSKTVQRIEPRTQRRLGAVPLRAPLSVKAK